MKNRKEGFTLVELIVVLVILAILMAILVPTCVQYIHKAQLKRCEIQRSEIEMCIRDSNVDTINGESELAPFLNILNEMHARQTSKKVKAAMHTRFANGAHYGAYAPVSYTHLQNSLSVYIR